MLICCRPRLSKVWTDFRRHHASIGAFYKPSFTRSSKIALNSDQKHLFSISTNFRRHHASACPNQQQSDFNCYPSNTSQLASLLHHSICLHLRLLPLLCRLHYRVWPRHQTRSSSSSPCFALQPFLYSVLRRPQISRPPLIAKIPFVSENTTITNSLPMEIPALPLPQAKTSWVGSNTTDLTAATSLLAKQGG